jgi:hypothetical protein
MTQNVPNWFITKFNDEVKHLAQQANQRLAGTVDDLGIFVGDDMFVPRMGAVEMYDSPAYAKLALANAQQDFIKVSADPKFVAFGLWDAHKNKLSINLAKAYAKSAHMATLRSRDRIIRNALADAAANGVVNTKGDPAVQIATIGDYGVVATLDDIAEGVAILGGNEYWEGEEVACVTPFRHAVNFSLDPLMNRTDVNKTNLPWNKLNWRNYEKLPTSGTAGDPAEGVDIFLYAKSAIVAAANDEMKEINERDGGALTDIIGYWHQEGAAARESSGIVRIKSKKNFSLFRQPSPIEDVG